MLPMDLPPAGGRAGPAPLRHDSLPGERGGPLGGDDFPAADVSDLSDVRGGDVLGGRRPLLLLEKVEVYSGGGLIVRGEGFPGEEVHFRGLVYKGPGEFAQEVFRVWDQH